MAYQLKTTGLGAKVKHFFAVDPDTNTIKDFGNTAVNSGIQVGSNVTINSQAWGGNTRNYWKCGATATDADYIKFSGTLPNFTLSATDTKCTVVYIAELAGTSARIFGVSGTDNHFTQDNPGAGGSTFPNLILNSVSFNGGQVRPTAGSKRIFGASITRGGGRTFYWAADTDSVMSTAAGAFGAVNTNFNFTYLNRLGSSASAIPRDKSHAVIIFNDALTEAEWASLRDDWFNVLLDPIAPTGPTINTNPSNQSVTIGSNATFAVTATSSSGGLTYLWQVSTDGGSSWSTEPNGSGNTTATYITAATTVTGGIANNGYMYRCAVTDSNGTTNSNAATLTVTSGVGGIKTGLYFFYRNKGNMNV